jgi:hypothetical protein
MNHFMALARILLLVCCVAFVCASVDDARAANRPLETGLFDPKTYESVDGDLALDKTRAAGATTVRIWLGWQGVAPQGTTKPEDFNPRNPFDPEYNWGQIDYLVAKAVEHGLEPMLMVVDAPAWAERGTQGQYGKDPDPQELGYFVEAAVKRYSGYFGDIPRVSRWELWNEPNLHKYLMPQYDAPYRQTLTGNEKALSPDRYRAMLKTFADAVHLLPDNIVVAGELAPFGRTQSFSHAVPPLRFMRELLCVNKHDKPKPRCEPVHFDVWSHHPYTEGGPNHSAASPENASMGDLPEMRKILDVAVRAGHVISQQKVGFWITEFSWDTKPPDSGAVPEKLHARWVAEALYRMWQARVSLVVWFKIVDEARAGADGYHYESGLYASPCDAGWSCAKPKLALTAFRFPFVAFRKGNHVRVWGRTPDSDRANVIVEQREDGRWRRIGQPNADGNGIFKTRLRTAEKGPVRARVKSSGEASGARVSGARSLPFRLMKTPDRFVPVFGGGTPPQV